jgi:hypothetical protein
MSVNPAWRQAALLKKPAAVEVRTGEVRVDGKLVDTLAITAQHRLAKGVDVVRKVHGSGALQCEQAAIAGHWYRTAVALECPGAGKPFACLWASESFFYTEPYIHPSLMQINS